MIKVIYCPEGECVSDFFAEEYAEKKLENASAINADVKIGTEYMLTCFVFKLINKEYNNEDVRFFIKDKEVLFNDVFGLDDNNVERYGISPLIDKILYQGIENFRAKRKNDKATEKMVEEAQKIARRMQES